jgi:hypothetical protein
MAKVKAINTPTPSTEELQMYFDFGVGFTNKKVKRNTIKIRGTGIGLSKNILNREEAVKSEAAIKLLGGKTQEAQNKKNKRNGKKINIAVALDKQTFEKFNEDCQNRCQTVNFRIASIVLNRFPQYFEKTKGASIIVNITKTGQHAHTDFLKRVGFGGINKLKGRRLIKQVVLGGKYQTVLYPILVQLCIDNNMSMGCFIGSLLEAEYKNFNSKKKINRIIARAEAEGALHSNFESESDFEKRCEKAILQGSMIDATRSQSIRFKAAISRQMNRIINRLHTITSANLDMNSMNANCSMSKDTQLSILDTQVVNRCK